MAQEIKQLKIDEIHLWTENPRDPVDSNMSDQDVILRAIENNSGNWNLDKMLDDLGETYYFNEIPTVVEDPDAGYIAYDGNRRLAVIKCLKDASLYAAATSKLPIFGCPPEIASMEFIPCNVCDRETALDIVEKTHSSAGKWGKLQYEQFLHYHRGKPKGKLMALDEASNGMVSNNKLLNQEYVENRLLSESSLNKVGLSIRDGQLFSSLDDAKTEEVISGIESVMINKLSDARTNPGKLKDALIQLDSDKFKDIPEFNDSSFIQVKSSSIRDHENPRTPRRVPVRQKKHQRIFGGKVLRPKGERSNELYRAIEFVYDEYLKNPDTRSYLLPFIGFSMRLLLEIVAQEYYTEKDINHGDAALKNFDINVVKPLLKKATDSRLLNDFSLGESWVSEKINSAAILNKWAHGTMDCSETSVVGCSEMVAYVIQEIWSR
ncbi:MAG: hypothetical protein KIC37_05245 [Coriobacteriaceae bacterium]|nr:hypothetical protein [Coriobacteriaceae bacterium]